MKLVRADGNTRMQQALSHSYVHIVVDILLQYRDILGVVAEILQKLVQPTQDELVKALDGIRTVYSEVDTEGDTVVPPHITNLLETLDKLYSQNIEKIQDQRGAIVELFGRKLVCPRYNTDQECSNSRRFEDDRGRRITEQEVDIAALSHTRRHIEGYECKLKARGLTSDDCIDLAYLIKAAQENDYLANVGVISFDSDNIVKRQLKHLQPTFMHLPFAKSIRVYGLESIETLQSSPFEQSHY